MLRVSLREIKMDFWEIYDQYYPRVRSFIISLVRDEWVADDLSQETFARVQASLTSLRDPTRVSSWIFRIAYNLCQDHFRSVKASTRAESGDRTATEPPGQPTVHQALEQHQMGQCVQAQIDLLPESLRTVIILFDLMELSHQEIAEILEISVENAKVRLHRARKQLRAILEEKCTFEVDERNVLVCEPNCSERK
ncbi:MAG: RNA polymerase sigma factor [Deltaproteobacteria bacterium]